jgi:hypothetical protein
VAALYVPLTAEVARQQALRQQWLLGRTAELLKQPVAAAADFRACPKSLEGGSAVLGPAAEDAAPNEQPAPACGPAVRLTDHCS